MIPIEPSWSPGHIETFGSGRWMAKVHDHAIREGGSAETIWKEKMECKEWRKRRARRREVEGDNSGQRGKKMRREDFDEDIFEVRLLSKDCDVTGQMGDWQVRQISG